MKSYTPSVTIIVLNWNGQELIDGFFDSVYAQDYPAEKIDILFVDNASSDNSVAYFQQKKYERAKLIQTGSNYGYSGGNNFGFREASGEFVAVCNNDLTLDPSLIRHLVDTALTTDADVVVPKLVAASGNHHITNAGSELHPNETWAIIERGIDASFTDREFNSQSEVTAFCGACPLFRRSFLESVGLFDKNFFLYWEDGDLSWRGQAQNKKYMYEPKAVAYHATSSSTGGSQSDTFTYYVSRNRVLILIKHAKIRVALKAFAQVSRDHVLYKLQDLQQAIVRGTDRRKSLHKLWLGIRILLGIIAWTPYMTLKRYGILREETL